MKLIVEVELDADGIRSAQEVGHAINQALVKQSASALDPLNQHEAGAIRDGLGRAVGKWEVVGS